MAGKDDAGVGKSTALQTLRKQAEEKLTAVEKALTDMPTSEVSTLVHELNIHQVELEMQNEELRKSQTETERSRKAYQDLWERSPAGYLIVDFTGRVTAVNRAAQRLFGRPEKALLNKRFSTLVAPENHVPVHLVLERSTETGLAERQDIRILNPDGTMHIYLLEVNSLGGDRGREQMQAVLTDVTKQKQAEEAVRKANDELEIKVLERSADLVETNKKLEHEIEESKRVQLELRMSKEKYRILADNITIGVALINTNMEVLAVNQQLRKLFPHIHIDQKSLCYQAFHDPPKEGVCTYCQALQTFQDGQVHESLAKIPTGDGIKNCRIISSPVKDSTGKVIAGIEMVEDVTDRLRIQKALEESERQFKSIFNNSPIGFYRTTPDGQIIDANPAIIQMLGYASFEELLTVNLETSDFHPDYSRREFRERLERDGKINGLETFWKRLDGTVVYVRENTRAVRDSDDKVIYYEGTIEDISDQKQATDQIRHLSQQLIKAQESERQMISRELHDRVAQDLSTLLIGLNALSDNQPETIPEVRNKALELSEILGGTIEAVRDLSYELHLAGLNDMGLVPALSMYCEEFTEKTGLAVDFQATGMNALKMGFETEMNIYRLIQEGLNNIRKHADASQAVVNLVGTYPNIILRIEDDGKGFDVEKRARAADSEKRMGLRSMAERVSLIQGKMTIQSKSTKGTKIYIKFPY